LGSAKLELGFRQISLDLTAGVFDLWVDQTHLVEAKFLNQQYHHHLNFQVTLNDTFLNVFKYKLL